MTSFMLKIIGVVTMLFDHIGDIISRKVSFSFYFNLIGRIAFPIFSYQLVQGYLNTKDFKKYILRITLFALISQIPFSLFLSTYTNEFVLNIFFTFLFAILTIFLYKKCNEKFKNNFLGLLIVVISSIVAHFIKLDYGAFGILLIFVFYFFETEFKDKNLKLLNINLSTKKIFMTISVLFLSFVKYIPDIIKYPFLTNRYLQFSLFTFLPMLFILFYNHKEGPKLKYFFYIFYPLHLLILYLIFIWAL